MIGKSSSSASSTVCWACGAPGHPHVPRWPAVAGGADCWGAGPDRCFTCVAPSAPSRRETLKRTVTGGQHRPRRSPWLTASWGPGDDQRGTGETARGDAIIPRPQSRHRAGLAAELPCAAVGPGVCLSHAAPRHCGPRVVTAAGPVALRWLQGPGGALGPPVLHPSFPCRCACMCHCVSTRGPVAGTCPASSRWAQGPSAALPCLLCCLSVTGESPCHLPAPLPTCRRVWGSVEGGGPRAAHRVLSYGAWGPVGRSEVRQPDVGMDGAMGWLEVLTA